MWRKEEFTLPTWFTWDVRLLQFLDWDLHHQLPGPQTSCPWLGLHQASLRTSSLQTAAILVSRIIWANSRIHRHFGICSFGNGVDPWAYPVPWQLFNTSASFLWGWITCHLWIPAPSHSLNGSLWVSLIKTMNISLTKMNTKMWMTLLFCYIKLSFRTV